MLKTAVQHESTVTMSLKRLLHPYNPQNTVTTSSIRIYYVMRNSYQHKIGVFLYSIEVLLDSILIYIIYCTPMLWNIIRLQPDSFKSMGVAKCRLPLIAILDVVSADVVDECRPSVCAGMHRWPTVCPGKVSNGNSISMTWCHHASS